MNLVLIETVSNQSYIFATNRRRENVGASELVLQAGTTWVFDALRDELEFKFAQVNDIVDARKNVPIEGGSPAEVVYVSSGKALLIVRDPETGRHLVSSVTRRALQEAPGLSVTGVIGASFDSLAEADIPHQVRDVHLEHESLRAFRPGPSARHLRIPIVAQCASSGLPAQVLDHEPSGRQVVRSRASLAKAGLREAAYARMGWEQAPDADADERPWAAIIHADGNRFGRYFLDFEKCVDGGDDPRTYVEKLRRFSLAIDEATRRAYSNAVQKLGGPEAAGVLPLVLGGDDVTVFCGDGSRAIELAAAFLEEFEAVSADPELQGGVLLEVARRSETPRLTACAGVAVVKAHFPFHAAYALAEDLTSEAKRRCREQGLEACSALSLHVLYDSSVTSLADVRARQTVGGDRTFGSPYVITKADGLPEQGRTWATLHAYEQLALRVAAVGEVSAGKRSIPRSQIGEWRKAARLGRAAGDAAYRLSRHRYAGEAMDTLEADEGSLFWTEAGVSGDVSATPLIDAVAIAQLGRGEAR